MLDQLPDFVPVSPQSYLSWEGVEFLSKYYLSGTRVELGVARSIKTEGKFHLVELVKDRSLSVFFIHVVKIVSYITVILPLVAYAMKRASIHFGTRKICYYQNEKAYQSYFVECAADPNRFSEMKALYCFDRNILFEMDEKILLNAPQPPRNRPGLKGPMTAFMAACKAHNVDAINWLYSVNPAVLHRFVQPIMGLPTNAFFQACEGHDAFIIQHLFNLDQRVLFDVPPSNIPQFSNGFNKLCMHMDLKLIQSICQNASEDIALQIRKDFVLRHPAYNGFNLGFLHHQGLSQEKLDYLYTWSIQTCEKLNPIKTAIGFG